MKNYTCQRPKPENRMLVRNKNPRSSYYGQEARINHTWIYEYEVTYLRPLPNQNRYHLYAVSNFHNLFEVIERPN